MNGKKISLLFAILSFAFVASAEQARLVCRSHDGRVTANETIVYEPTTFSKYPSEGFAFEISGREIYSYSLNEPGMTRMLAAHQGLSNETPQEIQRAFPCENRRSFAKLRAEKTYFCSAGSTLERIPADRQVQTGEFKGCADNRIKVSDKVD